MERRSRRSTGSEKGNMGTPARGRPPTKKSPVKGTPVAVKPPKEPEPEPEVVLNARGMPARQRKKNPFYFDEATMITPDTMARSKSLKRIKAEPVEVEEEYEEDHFVGSSPTRSPPRAIPTPRSTPTARPVVIPRPLPTPRIISTPSSEGTDSDVMSPVASPVRQPKPKSPVSTPTTAGEGFKGKRGGKQGLPPRNLNKSLPPTVRQKKAPEDVASDFLPASSATKPVLKAKALKQVDKEKKEKQPKPKIDIRKKLKMAAKEGEELEVVSSIKKPKMQVIRIKREPDMSLGTPEHVITPEYEPTYRPRERRSSEKIRREQQENRKIAPRIDERLLKEDFSEEAHSSTAMRSQVSTVPSPPKLVHFPKQEAEQPRIGLDKKTAHDISIRLRNLLKLPKAHKWVCYEWFYSNIDKVLFEGENDFQICLKESFPQLKVRKMARVQWCKVRRLMGKPRRCSQSFFDEEREELNRRRQKIRMIQQRKLTDFNYKELPDEIPLQLVIGTKVTSRLRKPQDGLFTGTIDGVDTSNNTYRITFDRPGLGTHSIPDYEVLSNDPPETVSISTFALKIPRRNFSFGGFQCRNPLLMGEEVPGLPKSPFPVDGMLGGFPVRLLDMIVRLSKLLKGKREKIIHLKELNVEAEKLRSYGKNFNKDFRLRYARVVVDLESMNTQMGLYLDGIQQYCLEIAQDHGSFQMVIPEHVQDSCRQEALLLVDTYNTNKNRNMVQGHKTLQLIADMASLLLQVKVLSSGDRNLYELKSIKDTMTEMKASLGGKNLQIFQERVEIPMNRIQAGLTLPPLTHK